jgi:hypothetical protein
MIQWTKVKQKHKKKENKNCINSLFNDFKNIFIFRFIHILTQIFMLRDDSQ